MNENMIITIGCQFGSGGREIGKALAEEDDRAAHITERQKCYAAVSNL